MEKTGVHRDERGREEGDEEGEGKIMDKQEMEKGRRGSLPCLSLFLLQLEVEAQRLWTWEVCCKWRKSTKCERVDETRCLRKKSRIEIHNLTLQLTSNGNTSITIESKLKEVHSINRSKVPSIVISCSKWLTYLAT